MLLVPWIMLVFALKGLNAGSPKCSSLNADLWNGLESSLSDADLSRVIAASNTSSFRTYLEPILRVRRVDTPEHDIVRDFIAKSMQELGWHTEVLPFTDSTPYGKKRFSNIVSTQYLYAVKRFVIACHYDSKWSPSGFLGAVDSAVPCAMMLDLARALNDTLWRSKWRFEEADFSLQFMFLDGEEAFENWTPTDSLYGARNLANSLVDQSYDLPVDYAGSSYQNCQSFEETRQIDRIALFMLLDLIGTRDTQFENFFANTGSIYSQLAETESNLRSKGLLNSRATSVLFRTSRSGFGGIEDDHLPFMRRNVPILHLISVPFPSVWHTINDNMANLDWPTIDNLNRILRVFVCRYFGLVLEPASS